MPSNRLILCHPLLLPSVFPSIGVFSSDLDLRIRWPKYWSFSFSIHPSNEYSGLIFFRMDWLDLLAVQGTLKSLLQHHSSKASVLKSLLQHHSSKASVLWHSAFFMVRLSHPYMTTGKTMALTRSSPSLVWLSVVVPLCRHNLLKHWPLLMKLQPPFPSLWAKCGTESSSQMPGLSDKGSFFLNYQRETQVWSKPCSLMNNKSICKGIPGVLGPLVVTGDKDQVYFLLYHISTPVVSQK